MLSKTFSVMIIISVVSAVLTGNTERMAGEFAVSLSDAVGLCITLMGMMCFWSGFMNVLKDSGTLKHLSKAIKPILKLIYDNKNLDDDVLCNLSASFAANFLGLGNAALPIGIEAVKSFEKSNVNKVSASDGSIMFAVLNTVPFQLVPSTLIALRSKYRSVNPFDVVPGIWLCSVIISVFAVFVCKLLAKLSKGDG